jgi:hypothetical protein
LRASRPSPPARRGTILYQHPGRDEWHLSKRPFDPADGRCFVGIATAGGPVPTGARPRADRRAGLAGLHQRSVG